MNLNPKILCFLLCTTCFGWPLPAQQPLSLQQLVQAMNSNYELLKREGSLVQANQANVKATQFQRLPHVNVMAQATVSSNNNLIGAYVPYGMIPSLVGATWPQSNLSAIGGDAVVAGINWEATNFGEYKAQANLAKSDLLVQVNALARTQYDLEGYASSYYIELLRQYELEIVQQDNVSRLQNLKTTIVALVKSGVRPGVDSAVAEAELSKSVIAFQLAQKNLAQSKVQLSALTGLPGEQLNPDTSAESKLTVDGAAFVLSATADTVHHPYINLYTSVYNQTRARWKLEKNSYYPKLFLDADAWARGSSLGNNDVYNNDLVTGYEPGRFNYLVGLTLTYDIVNIARKRLNSAMYRYQAEAASHLLENEKINLSSDVQQALLEKEFQYNRLSETRHQLDEAATAYTQQLSLYNNGLSSIIELNTALDYYIQAERDYVEAKTGLMKSVINYALVTNTFTAMLQTIKL